MFYTAPQVLPGAEGVIAESRLRDRPQEDETWDREDAKPRWIHRAVQPVRVVGRPTGPKNDTRKPRSPSAGWTPSDPGA